MEIPQKATTCMEELASPLLPVEPCSGCLIQTTNKAKIQTQSLADKITASFNLAHQRGKKKTKNTQQQLSTNFTLHKVYTN